MRLSKCVFFIKDKDKVLAYNNLNFKVLELEDSTYRGMKEGNFKEAFTQDELEYLIDNKFLVEDDYDEIKVRENIKSNIKEKSKQQGTAEIGYIRISLTENCNLRCKYCFVNKIVDEKKNISEENFKKAIHYLIDHNDEPRVQYFGGEPLLRMELIHLGHKMFDDALKEGKISSYKEDIVTNGTLLDEDKMKFFIESQISLTFSLDGWKEINDKNRVDSNGNGTFDVVINNITEFRKRGGNAGIILTPNQENIEELDRIVEFFVTEYQITDISINAPQPNNEGWDIDGKTLAEKIINIYLYCEKNKVNLSAPGMNLIHNLLAKRYQIFSCSNYGNVLDKKWGMYLFSNGEMSYCLVEKTPESMDHIESFKINDRINDWHMQCNSSSRCNACIAYSVCGGKCSMERCLINDHSVEQNKCIFNREILKWGLMR